MRRIAIVLVLLAGLLLPAAARAGAPPIPGYPNPWLGGDRMLVMPNVNFGSQHVGVTVEKLVTVTNVSTVPIWTNWVSASWVRGPGEFGYTLAHSNCFGTTIEPGSSAVLAVTFRALGVGHATGDFGLGGTTQAGDTKYPAVMRQIVGYGIP
jgi:hypothetical protein